MTSPALFASVATAIDQHGISRRQLGIVAGCALALLIDGLDLQLLAFAAPLLLVEWSISRAELGPALSAAFIGMAIGNGLGGWLGDRIGRKRTMLCSVAYFGAVTCATALVTDTTQLTAMRFLGGVGFGAVVPNAVTLASEWMSAKRRSLVIGALMLGTPLGGVVGSAAASLLMEQRGWRFLFVICGAATFAALIVLAMCLIESPGLLEKRGRLDQAEQLLRRVLGPVYLSRSPPQHRQVLAINQTKGSFRQLFQPVNRRTNAGLFLAFFANAYFGFSLLAWLPVVLSGARLSLSVALNGSLAYNIASGIGVMLGALFAPRLNSKLATSLMVGGLLVSASLLLHLLQQSDPESAVMLIFCSLAMGGLSSGALQTTLYALSSSAYAIEYRATGLGMVSASSRIGGILAALGGGALLGAAADGGSSVFFLSLIALAAAGGAGVLLFDKHWERGTPKSAAA